MEINNNAGGPGINQQLAHLTTEIALLNQRVNQQEQHIASQQELLIKQQEIMGRQQEEIALLKNLLAEAILANSNRMAVDDKGRNKEALSKKDKSPTKYLSYSAMLGLFMAVIFFFASAGVAQSRLVVNPQGYTEQFGAIMLPAGSTITGTLVSNVARLGVVATGNPSLDLSALPVLDTGVYASGSAYGVYATSDSSQGVGLYASNTATSGAGSGYAIFGSSQKGAGVGGTSFGTGNGVYGASSNGTGVYGSGSNGSGVMATSTFGAPLTVVAGNTPTSGSRQFGDMYVDSTGKLYIWAKSDDGLTSNWRRLQFAT